MDHAAQDFYRDWLNQDTNWGREKKAWSIAQVAYVKASRCGHHLWMDFAVGSCPDCGLSAQDVLMAHPARDLSAFRKRQEKMAFDALLRGHQPQPEELPAGMQ